MRLPRFSKPTLETYHLALVIFFGVCMLLGGASAEGGKVHAVFNAIAVMALTVPLFISKSSYVRLDARMVLVFAFLFLLLVFFQIISLPNGWWSNLVDRDIVQKNFSLLGLPLDYTPLTLAPVRIFTSASMIILPLLVILTLTARRNRLHTNVKLVFIPIIAIISGLLGLAQLLSGGMTLYDYTSNDLPIGIFSNINHQATLMIMAIPFIAVLAWHNLQDRSRLTSNSFKQMGLILLFLFFLAILILSRSLAGYLIVLPILAGSLFLLIGKSSYMGKTQIRRIFAASAVLLLISYFLIDPQELRVESVQGSAFSRTMVAVTMKDMIGQHFVWGSGLGSFIDVYRLYEDGDLVINTIFNHAHNDYLEWIVETGIPGILLLGTFLMWLSFRIIKVWRSKLSLETNLARAASLSLLVVVIHSLVDYPLRTYTIAIAAAFCIGIILSASQSKITKLEPATQYLKL